jgi:multiple RNA-binding domain-containing protein 1
MDDNVGDNEDAEGSAAEESADSSSSEDEEPKEKKSKEDEVVDEEEEEEAEPETTLFVKNLNFETTDAALCAKFEPVGVVRSAVVSKKRDPSNPTNTLSMGFGFVQFQRHADAQTALKDLQVRSFSSCCLFVHIVETLLNGSVFFLFFYFKSSFIAWILTLYAIIENTSQIRPLTMFR